jgi:hypothetical protein
MPTPAILSFRQAEAGRCQFGGPHKYERSRSSTRCRWPGPDSDGNRQIVDTIGELFNTEITREDSN